MGTYLVTGATGFLGAHVVRALKARGHDVAAFSRERGGDVLDPDGVRNAAAGCEGAFHCAGGVSRKLEDAEAMYRVHVEGTKNVLAACALENVKRVVVASTSGTIAVSEAPERIATEQDPPPIGLISRWPYYRAKLFAERAALERGRAGFDVICVNPSLLLGPGDLKGSSTGDVRLFLESAIPLAFAGGLSFVDVRDAAEAMCLAMDRGRAGQRYLLGACNVTIRDFFGRLERVSGVRAPVLTMPRSLAVARIGAKWAQSVSSRVGMHSPVDPVGAEMAQCFWYLDASKAHGELGWLARDPNETLYDTVQDLRTRGVVWQTRAP
jgi:dihydroflavonol-4-reductase